MKNQEDAIVLFDTLNKAITEPVTSKSPILDFASFIEKYKYVNNTVDQTKTLLEIYNSKNDEGLIKTYENIVKNNQIVKKKEPNSIIDNIYEDFKKEYPNILPIANAKPEIIQTPKTEVATKKDTKPKTVSPTLDNQEVNSDDIHLGLDNKPKNDTLLDSSTKNNNKSSSFKIFKDRQKDTAYLLKNKDNTPVVNKKSMWVSLSNTQNESADIGKSKTSVEPILKPAKDNAKTITKLWSSFSKQKKPNDTISQYQLGGDGSSSGTIDPLRATVDNLIILQQNAQKIITKLSLKTDIIKK
jgi:hypothetical protein